MITADLISFINKQLENNISRDLIISKLEKVGWLREDIEEGFAKVEDLKKKEFENTKNTEEKESKEYFGGSSISDRYREPIDLDAEPLAKKEIPNLNKKEEDIKNEKKENEVLINTKNIETNQIEPESKVPENKEIVIEPVLDDKELNAPKVENKIWLPRNIPIKEISERDEKIADNLIVQNVELPEKTITASMGLTKENIVEDKNNDKTQEFLNKQTDIIKNGQVFEELSVEEKQKQEELKNYNLEKLPKISPITTYPMDVINTVNQIKESGGVIKKPINKKLIKRLIVLFVVLILGGGIFWLFNTGKINLKNINIPFINKDPRTLILDNSKILSSLKSYKTETILELSSPSLASITAGLLTGEAVNSLDKDNLVLISNSIISQKDGNFVSDDTVLVKGSILEKNINTTIKNDGEYLYIDIPDLSKVVKGNIPPSRLVKMNKEEISSLPSLFDSKIENILNKINLYKLLTSGMSSYIDQDTLGSYDDIVKGVEIVKKGEDVIRGVNTYQYSLSPDKQLFKKLLTRIAEKFSGLLSDADYENLTMIISSLNVSSFDVWVGKGDNTIYQYKITLSMPISRILGFEDKSVGDNVFETSLLVTYYDFNIPNEISPVSSYVDMESFIKEAKIERIKEKVKDFKILAENLQKVEKKYGVTSNTKGSCMSPVSGSLFSPTGHSKSAVLPVSEISSMLNDILGTTYGIGSCYSTPTAWSFAIPVSDNYDQTYKTENYDSFYCIDNKGVETTLNSLPKGVSCQTQTTN